MNESRRTKSHAAQGARVVALLTSVAATGGIGVAMAAADTSDAQFALDASLVAAASEASTTAAIALPTTTAVPSATAASATAAGSVSTTRSTASTSSSAATGAKYIDGTYVGTSQSTKWGPVQVQVIISGGQITDVVTLQVPTSDNKSASINSRAVPILKAQAISTQSAQLDVVSGATYTSNTYEKSLQSALDRAALGAAAA